MVKETFKNNESCHYAHVAMHLNISHLMYNRINNWKSVFSSWAAFFRPCNCNLQGCLMHWSSQPPPSAFHLSALHAMPLRRSLFSAGRVGEIPSLGEEHLWQGMSFSLATSGPLLPPCFWAFTSFSPDLCTFVVHGCEWVQTSLAQIQVCRCLFLLSFLILQGMRKYSHAKL